VAPHSAGLPHHKLKIRTRFRLPTASETALIDAHRFDLLDSDPTHLSPQQLNETIQLTEIALEKHIQFGESNAIAEISVTPARVVPANALRSFRNGYNAPCLTCLHRKQSVNSPD
jgi:hypothetical protein